MKTLPLVIKKNGITLKQIMRVGMAAIYQEIENREGQRGRFDNYEVGIIQKNAAREIAGVQIEASESWPPAESWGVKGWTFTDRNHADKKLNELKAMGY